VGLTAIQRDNAHAIHGQEFIERGDLLTILTAESLFTLANSQPSIIGIAPAEHCAALCKYVS
jgi:hypothetical protein